MSIECGRHSPDEKLGAFPDEQSLVAVHGHCAVWNQAISRERSTMADFGSRPSDLRQVEGHVAHQSLDWIGSEAIVTREGIPLEGGGPVVGDARQVITGYHDVLCESLRHPSDGACP
ncbi:hypothetical protein [Bradyrhizobium sp. RT3b]|uniref:hypothetical protein n=1 Tax=Bradyrhizobium sp. RT3b TaxID=3156334 RepID=UPI003390A0CD